MRSPVCCSSSTRLILVVASSPQRLLAFHAGERLGVGLLAEQHHQFVTQAGHVGLQGGFGTGAGNPQAD